MSTELAPKTKSSKRKASATDEVVTKKPKKEKKLKKTSKGDADAVPATKRKSKTSAADQVAPATPPTTTKKAKQTVSEDSSVTLEQVAADKQPADLDNFRLSQPVKALLRKKGIETLFAIQQATLDHCLDGNDLVGRARTGCGKTLAFVLPIIESLGAAEGGSATRRAYGRAPSVIVLAPTRELAKQVWECDAHTHTCGSTPMFDNTPMFNNTHV